MQLAIDIKLKNESCKIFTKTNLLNCLQLESARRLEWGLRTAVLTDKHELLPWYLVSNHDRINHCLKWSEVSVTIVYKSDTEVADSRLMSTYLDMNGITCSGLKAACIPLTSDAVSLGES